MAVPSYGSGLVPFLESQGLETVRRLRNVENHFHSLDWAVVDKWILTKEAELRDEGVLIARKALRNSTWALILSIVAITAAAIDNREKIEQFISQWFSK